MSRLTTHALKRRKSFQPRVLPGGGGSDDDDGGGAPTADDAMDVDNNNNYSSSSHSGRGGGGIRITDHGTRGKSAFVPRTTPSSSSGYQHTNDRGHRYTPRGGASAKTLATVEFSLERIVYPTSKEPSYRDPEVHAGAEGFVIAIARCIIDGIPSQQNVQGDLPYHAPYYYYRCQFEHDKHPKYGSFLKIRTVLECTRLPLTLSFFSWMLSHELNWPFNEQRAALALVPGTADRSTTDNTPITVPTELQSVITEQTRFGREHRLATLRKWFPQDAPAVQQDMSVATSAVRTAFFDVLTRAPWRLLFRDNARQLGLRHKRVMAPSVIPLLRVEHVGDALSALPGMHAHAATAATPVGQEEGPALTEAAQQLMYDAVACYSYIRKWCKGNGHTVFYTHNIRTPEWRGAPLQFLVRTAAVVVRETIETLPCYWLRKDRDSEDTVLAQLDALHARRRMKAPTPCVQAASLPLPEANEAQNRVFTAVQAQHITLVRGGPGTGKTWTIERLLERYGKQRLFLGTLTNSMKAGHHERGMRSASTIHRPIVDLVRLSTLVETLDADIVRFESSVTEHTPNQKQRYNKLCARAGRWRTRLTSLIRRLEAYEVAIIDEFSNVDIHLLSRLLPIFPNLRALVLVFDEWQIRPIGKGQPCIDMLSVLDAKYGVQLQDCRRVSGPAARQIVANDRALVEGRLRDIQFTTVVAGSAFPTAQSSSGIPAAAAAAAGVDSEGCFLVTPSGRGWVRDMVWIYTTLLGHEWTDIQILVLLNKERRILNNALGHALHKPNGSTSPPPPNHTSTQSSLGMALSYFVPGMRLTVHTNFEPSRLCIDARTGNLLGPDRSRVIKRSRLLMHASAPGATNPLDDLLEAEAEEEEEEDDDDGPTVTTQRVRSNPAAKPRKKLLPVSDAIGNGEVIRFAGWREYNLVQRRWLPIHPIMATAVPPGRARFLVAEDGRRFCVHAGYSPLSAFLPAWAITVDKSQGLEFAMPPFILPAIASKETGSFGLRHLHVVMSRGKRGTLLYGTREQFTAMARNPETPRQTMLAWRLTPLVDRWIQRAEGIPAGFLT